MKYENCNSLWWKMMQVSAAASHPRHKEALRLEAILDFLVPEEPPYTPQSFIGESPTLLDTVMKGQRDQRQAIREELLNEVEKAYKGE